MELTREILRELLGYDQDTGVFTWRIRGRSWFESERNFKWWNNRYAGTAAGYVQKSARGYPALVIGVFGKFHRAHRLAFICMGGAAPKQVDHLNRDSTDNRWKNLAASSHSENMKNRSKQSSNTSGVTGVSWYKPTGKWRAQVKLDGVCKHLGYYTDLVEATEVVKVFRAANGFSQGHGKKHAKYVEKSVDSSPIDG